MPNSAGRREPAFRHDHPGADLGSELREKAACMTEDLREFAGNAGRAARDRLEPIETYIRTRPLTSVLIGAGAGLVLGLILRRRD